MNTDKDKDPLLMKKKSITFFADFFKIEVQIVNLDNDMQSKCGSGFATLTKTVVISEA